MSVADPGEGPGAPLFLDQTETRRAEKNFGGTARGSPPPLSEGVDDRTPPYLKIWIPHCM